MKMCSPRSSLLGKHCVLYVDVEHLQMEVTPVESGSIECDKFVCINISNEFV